MSQALATQSQSIGLSISKEQIDLVKNTIAQGATEAELKLYLYDCQRQGVHPLDRMIHFTKRGNKYTPVVSIDFLRARAEMTGEYAGNDDPVFDNEDNPKKATVTVYKIVNGERCSFSASARWSQYYPGDAAGYMWKKMPHLMLGKCAEALALRKAFPKQFAGIYTQEEMQQVDNFSGGVKETQGHEKISSPIMPRVSMVKEGKGDITEEPPIQSKSLLQQLNELPKLKDLTRSAKEILKAEELDPETASLIASEPEVIVFDSTNAANLEKEQPKVEFGDKKVKTKGPYYEINNENLVVYNSYTIKEKLQRNGFHWNGGEKTWRKTYSKFDEEALKEMINGK